jgi:predicted AAA+ superfamily ATPase
VVYKKRGLEERLLSFAEHFKVVLLTGARQVGKSTLLARLFPEVRRFVFDPLQDLYGARRDPDLFLDQFPPPLILDEIQYAPELLPSIKRRVDESGKPGDYLLSGS